MLIPFNLNWYIFASLFLCILTENIPRKYSYNLKEEQNTDYWKKLGYDEIQVYTNIKNNLNKAKNVILFLGDGMGISTLTAARILSGQLQNKSGEEGKLFFESFPNSGLIKTYNVNKQTPDSAGTATAFLTGVKTNFETLGVNAHVYSETLNCNLIKKNSVDSILETARRADKATGLVTTARVTHATPAASFAHTASRYFENDRNTPEALLKDGCKDIAKQLIEDEPGRSLNVILGGGKSNFLPSTIKVLDKENYKIPLRKDGLNLIKKWHDLKKEQDNLNKDSYKYVETLNELKNVDYSKVKHLFGLFNMSHVSYNNTLNKNRNEPTLTEMVESAINLLSKFDKGYVLLVEGGRIDHAHHENQGVMALYETVEFERAIKNAFSLIDIEETLVIVTADHSHSLTINGYPDRGTSIFGFSNYGEFNSKGEETDKNFTTLIYGNGPGHTDERINPKFQDTSSIYYKNYAAIHTKNATHGGEDVAIYSIGPWSHLFRSLHEQNYINHVMAFSACIGNYQNESHCSGEKTFASKSWIFITGFILFFMIIYYICKKKSFV